MQLEETGPTALGPAAASAIALASKGVAGSTVVICTDGLANVGLGAFDEAKTEEEKAKIGGRNFEISFKFWWNARGCQNSRIGIQPRSKNSMYEKRTEMKETDAVPLYEDRQALHIERCIMVGSTVLTSVSSPKTSPRPEQQEKYNEIDTV